jgi:hypothetical protein
MYVLSMDTSNNAPINIPNPDTSKGSIIKKSMHGGIMQYGAQIINARKSKTPKK